jgi:hypothetical protein
MQKYKLAKLTKNDVVVNFGGEYKSIINGCYVNLKQYS